MTFNLGAGSQMMRINSKRPLDARIIVNALVESTSLRHVANPAARRAGEPATEICKCHNDGIEGSSEPAENACGRQPLNWCNKTFRHVAVYPIADILRL